MDWYWYIIIILAVFVVLFVIALFGSKKLKEITYDLVLQAEKQFGEGKGADKFNQGLETISAKTKGIIPASVLKSIIEWAVRKMKILLLENEKSQKKHNAEK